jgi:hypothetical protein
MAAARAMGVAKKSAEIAALTLPQMSGIRDSLGSLASDPVDCQT